ncbi:spermatogenesis-associated protein 31E1-like [Hylobates moloch]|uniref:spermatogenesis-associated protein 31E1-like n=1 Tax=Hylobates moloch TaxID=81572 RepID=UPI002676BBD8|nr:spermatogenesis-associated protein 31E1-like [Hylobates moloch]
MRKPAGDGRRAGDQRELPAPRSLVAEQPGPAAATPVGGFSSVPGPSLSILQPSGARLPHPQGPHSTHGAPGVAEPSCDRGTEPYVVAGPRTQNKPSATQDAGLKDSTLPGGG